MYAKNVIRMILLNICLSTFCADKAIPLLETKQNTRKTEQKTELVFDRYKAKGRMQLWSHGSWAQGDYKEARQYLVEALEVDHEEAARFYAEHVNTLAVFRYLAADGNINLIDKILPLLCSTPATSFELKYKRGHDLPASDCSGLVAAVCADRNGKQKSEDTVMKILTTIIKFYAPKQAACSGRTCWGACTARCQDRRRAFITHGLAKAGELAIQHGYGYVTDLIYHTHQTFPTLQAIQAAENKKLPDLKKQLENLRTTQLTEKRTRSQSSYALLRTFNCIKDVDDSKKHAGIFVGEYLEQLAWPVIKNIRYRSWIGNCLSGVMTEPLACTRACP